MKLLRPYLLCLLGIIALLLAYPLLQRVGRDARLMQIKHDLMKQALGPSTHEQLYRLNRILPASFESIIRFTTSASAQELNSRIERKGILVKRPRSKAVVLICHGFTCTKDDVRFSRSILFQTFSTLSFDFRAHGECRDGQTCTFGEAEKIDVLAAIKYIRTDKDLRNLPIVVYGFSMGAVAALLAQAEHKNLFAAAILDCPFDSTDNIIERLLEEPLCTIAGYEIRLPGRTYLKKYAYNPTVQDVIKKIVCFGQQGTSLSPQSIETRVAPVDALQAAAQITIPTYVIVCKHDKRAPARAVTQLYSRLKGPKKLWVTNGRGHFDSFFYNPEKYAYEINSFIHEALSQTLAPAQLYIDEPCSDQERRIFEVISQGKETL